WRAWASSWAAGCARLPAGGSRARTSRAVRSRSARCSPARTRSAPAFALLGLRSDHRGPGPVLRSSRLIGDRAAGVGIDRTRRGARGGRIPEGGAGHRADDERALTSQASELHGPARVDLVGVLHLALPALPT